MKAQHRIRRWTWAHRITALAFFGFLLLGAHGLSHWIRGSITATTVAGIVPFTDPLAALEVMIASGKADTTLVIGAMLLVCFSLVMGPVFCGWFCPLGLLLDLNDGIRKRLARLFERINIRLPDAGPPSGFRLFLLGTVLGISLTAGLPAFQTVSPINILSWAFLFYPDPALVGEAGFWEMTVTIVQAVAAAGGLMLLLPGVILLIEYFAPRIWCRSFCPAGALYSLIGRFAPFRVQIVTGDKPCRHCSSRCPMGIDVTEECGLRPGGLRPSGLRPGETKKSIGHPDCTRCGECIDTCHRGKLSLGFSGLSGSNKKKDEKP